MILAKSVAVGEKSLLDPVEVPADAESVTLELDSTWHTDPESIAVWGLDISTDGGATWQHWCTAARNGGLATTDGNQPINVFDCTAPVTAEVRDKGALFRPFFGVLKGTDVANAPITGTLKFS